MSGRRAYHPGRSPDNAKAIAAGDLRTLVEYLLELADIVWQKKSADTISALLVDRAMAARIYAIALDDYLGSKVAGRPKKPTALIYTMTDEVRALEAANEYETELKKRQRAAGRIEKDVLNRHGITRQQLRAALRANRSRAAKPGA